MGLCYIRKLYLLEDGGLPSVFDFGRWRVIKGAISKGGFFFKVSLLNISGRKPPPFNNFCQHKKDSANERIAFKDAISSLSAIYGLRTHVTGKKHCHARKIQRPDDPTNPQAALCVCSIEKDKKDNLLCRTESFCDAVSNEFEKILKYNNDSSDSSSKRIRQYADGGVDFVKRFKRQNLETGSDNVTPIRGSSPEKPSDDLLFVEKEKENSTGRFKWALCYDKGKEKGLFKRYSSRLSVKEAFSRQNL
ncbi:hypothetical protein INT47_004626 [Mucor saturninus]|uniref:Uncharacterized protein n=1 Tax=Mucor saturninus TaxID=64648 RepID=A0A8H7RJ54_9FUNG|nr:hypothetical protein INT47_004626 [Mucor saturninus]